MTKQLKVPYIPALDNCADSCKIAEHLSSAGTHDSIDVQPWPSFANKPHVSFNIAHSSTHIYVHFFTKGRGLRAVNTTNQSAVSSDSCVEFFVCPDAMSPRYFNFEFNCIGAVNASHRIERAHKTPLTDDEIAQILRISSCGTQPFDEKDGDFAWDLLIGIPLALFDIEYIPGHPITMRGNFYKCASASKWPHYLCWNPIQADNPDFHRPDCFGMLTLE